MLAIGTTVNARPPNFNYATLKNVVGEWNEREEGVGGMDPALQPRGQPDQGGCQYTERRDTQEHPGPNETSTVAEYTGFSVVETSALSSANSVLFHVKARAYCEASRIV